MNVAVQILGILGTVLSLILFHKKDMKNVLKVKLLIDIVWGTHYLLLGATAAVVTNVVCCLREIVFLNRNKKVFSGNWWLLVFVFLNWILIFFTKNNIYSFLPAVVSTLATYSFWQKKTQRARVIGIINNVLMFTYDIFVASYAGMVNESLAFISTLSAVIINQKDKSKNKEMLK